MALETATYIDDLVATNPVATDGLSQADDHIRLIKSTLKATFPNITGAVTATHTVLNGLDTRVSAIENGVHSSGTRMLFQQTAAPTGWTKVTTHNDKALRIVSGTVSTGGTNALSSLDATASGTISSSISGSIDSHTLTIDEIPAHTHFVSADGTTSGRSDLTSSNQLSEGFLSANTNWEYYLSGTSTAATIGKTSSTGGGSAHTHGTGSLAVTSTFTGSANSLDIAYVDVIIAEKD